MLDKAGNVLYVGKAKNLKKRVTSYFKRKLDTKTLQLVKQIKSIEITITRNEREALLLENNLIKSQKPRYNVIFKDDKSYPYLKLTVQDAFPRLSMHRGTKRDKNKYYGPYPNVREARESLTLLQNIFRLRQCDDTFFKTRTRPCLQYQIKRCSAPCVGYISQDHYKKDVDYARLFLEGKNQAVIEQLIAKMEKASADLEFEQAARIRDQIATLRTVQEHQIIMGDSKDIDVLGIALYNDQVCIHLLIIREGRILGSRQYFPNKEALVSLEEDNESTLLESFILQHYVASSEEKDVIPKFIVLPFSLKREKDIVEILQSQTGRQINFVTATRGDRLRWVEMATQSAHSALLSRAKRQFNLLPRFQALQEVLQLEALPERIECFDVSHTLGEATVVSCVVFGVEGPIKSSYRRYNIRTDTKGDDYGALKEGLTRHYARLKSEGSILPDICIVDGGKGQMAVAKSVLEELQVIGVVLLAIAKGPGRKAGLETVYWSFNDQAVKLQLTSQALHMLQQVRDEAHRFAIKAHQKRRAKKRKTSTLEQVLGIGEKRRLKLLQYFGGLQELLQASVEELVKVPGINRSLAERLYETLHGK